MPLPPLSPHVPIVDSAGRPTPEFLQWWQNQRDINDEVVPLGTGNEVSDVLDNIGATQGSILYRDSSNWNALGPGTAGRFLQTQGAGANPQWAAGSGAFTDLSDVPSSYSGKAGNVVAVNATEDGLEFISPGGGGGGSVTYTTLLSQNMATTNLTTTPVVVTGLSAYDEIIIVINDATTSGFVLMQFSPDGGTTWRSTNYSRLFITAAADDYLTARAYIFIGELGASIGSYLRMRDFNTATIFTSVEGQIGEGGQQVSNDTQWHTNLETHDALRIFMASGTATAGNIYIIGVTY